MGFFQVKDFDNLRFLLSLLLVAEQPGWTNHIRRGLQTNPRVSQAWACLPLSVLVEFLDSSLCMYGFSQIANRVAKHSVVYLITLPTSCGHSEDSGSCEDLSCIQKC